MSDARRSDERDRIELAAYGERLRRSYCRGDCRNCRVRLRLERHGPREPGSPCPAATERDGPRRCARSGDIGALAGPVQDPHARPVRHAHGTFDKQHAERLIVDRPAQNSVPRTPTAATGASATMSERASFDTWPETTRNAPTTLNLIVRRPAAGSKTYRSSVSFVFSPSVSRVLSLKVTSSRAAAPVDTVPSRMSGALRPSGRVVLPRVSLASPCTRLTVPIASCAAIRSLANTETSVVATMTSRCNMRLPVRNTISQF